MKTKLFKLKKIAFLIVMLCSLLGFSQTTYDFTTPATLTNTGTWITQADITIGGVAYRLTSGGNGGFTNQGSGGVSNSNCLRKEGAGGDSFSLQRVDGQPFQFYGLWVNHQSMNSYSAFYTLPPWYTLTAGAYQYQDMTAMTAGTAWNNYTSSSIAISPGGSGVTVTSVSITFQAILHYAIDNIIVGPTASALTATTSQTNVSCNGGSNGTASVNASGGTAPYSYSWSPLGGTGATATGLSVGTYTCTITDNTSTSITRNVTITQPTAISLTQASQTNIACFGGASGAAAVNPASGGAGGYTYNWTPGNPTGDGTPSVTGLSAGTWTCTVTDANACTRSVNFTVTQPTALALTPASQINISCNGGSNGTATVNPASGGAGGYTYNWTPGNPTGDGTTTVTGLTAGTWTCTVTDANACTRSVNFTVTQPTALALTPASQTNISCNGGSNGTATVNPASGGAGGYTYNWTPGNPTGDGTTTVTGLTAGTWTCTVTDANSCVATVNFTVTQPTALGLTPASQTNVACNGGSNGAATVNTATGGAGGYTYNWTPGNPTGDGTPSVTGLSAGTWTCTVTDANSCVATVNFTVTQPTALSLTPASQTNIACNGGSNGAASVNTATGGAGGYTYNWTPGNPTGDGTPSVTGLSAGTWTCTVTDANSCVATVNFTVTQPTALTLTPASQTNIACNGGSNGAATVNTATGGAGGYTYNWTPGNPTGDGTPSVTGLSAGTWTCTVTDANSCVATVNFTVTQPTALGLTPASQTNVACNGGSNGAATVNTATGGAGGYTYNWTPGNPTGDGTPSVTGLSAGTWTCTVTDANSCVATVNFTVTQPTALTLTPASQTNISCNGGSNGAAAVNTATGGAGGYTYDWTPGNPTGDGTPSVTGLTAGTWTCNVTDANGCTASVNFTVTQPTALGLTPASQTNVACNGGSNGAATVNTATGGAGGYTYDWTPGNPTGDGTPSVTGLTAGTWTCTVTDANGCIASVNFTVTQPTALGLTAASQTNIACNGGSNGAAAVNTATGGAGGYTYDWTPGNPTGDGTPSVTGLTAGTWTCTVTDANGCIASVNFTVMQPTALTLTPASQTNVACNAGSNGAAAVNTATGGAGGYTYDWTPGNPTGDGTPSVTGLTAGTWTCTVTDANGCIASVNFTVTQPTALGLTPASQTNIACNGGSNGAAAVNTATGGAGGYTYDWTPGNPIGDGTPSVTGLTAGTWTCTVTDANGCTTSVNFIVTQPTVLGLTPASQTNIACNAGSNGAATVNTATGGAGGYTYDWTPGNPTGDGTPSVTGLTAGTWTCTVTDANGCTASVNFTVTQPSALTATTSQTNVSCNGGSNGTASVVVSGGTAAYTYSWAPSGGTNATASGLTAGTYIVTIIDANACQITRTFTITEPTALASTTSQTNVSCNGGSNGSATVTITGGTGAYTYSWAPAGGTNATATGLSAGIYTVTILDANSCALTQSFTITEPTALVASIGSQADVSCAGASDGTATVAVTGGTGTYTYAWAPSGGSNATASGLSAGTYTVTVVDANNCSTTQSFVIGTVLDVTNPVIIAPADVAITTNAGCTATGVVLGTPTVSDNCLVASFSSNAPSVFPIGTTVVTWTVVDGLGNTATASQNVVVTDVTAPIVVTQNITITLDATGTTTVTPSMLDNGSTDNCTIDTITISQSTFDCSNEGVTTVTVTVTDIYGNSASANATVTIVNNFVDTDGDGIKNNCDEDDDNDGILDVNDNCTTVANPNQEDNDLDGIGDICDADDDNDGFLDEVDNCPFTYNDGQEDIDNDGIGDACDLVEINVSQAFTPNGDGINDTWVIINIQNHPNSVVRVYNRWGDELFKAKNYQNNWNGSFKGNETPEAASYYYQIDLDGNGTVDHDGWIYITR